MDRDRLKQLFRAYGGDASRWPAHERDEAERLASAGEPADADAARGLDRMLDAWVVDAASLDLRQRILDQAPGLKPSRWRSAGLWIEGACLAAACAAGLLAGLSLGEVNRTGRATSDRETEAVAAVGYDAGTIAEAPVDAETT